MVVDDESIAVGLLNKVANLYDRESLELVTSMTGHTDHIWSIDMNKKHVVTGSWDATCTVWDRKSGTKSYYFRHPHEREISSGTFENVVFGCNSISQYNLKHS